MIEDTCCMRLRLLSFLSFFVPVVLLYHYYSCCTAHICFFEITNVLQNLRCCLSVCLSVSSFLLFSSLFWGDLYILLMFYIKKQCFIPFHSIPFKTFKIPLKSFPHPVFFFTSLCVSRLAFLEFFSF